MMIVSLYNLDCMELMTKTPDQYYDMAIVDPPYFSNAYSIITPGGNLSTTGIERRKYAMPHWEPPTEAYFRELFRVSKAQIIWGINYFPICPGPGRIVWDKCRDHGTSFSDCEIAYCSKLKHVRIFRYMWNGMLQGKSLEEGTVARGNKKTNEKRIHPTQKPVDLYRWLFREFVKEGDRVLDTHGGSMSSAIAAIEFGYGSFDLCEIDPAYFASGKQRLVSELERLKPKPVVWAPGGAK